LGKLKEVKMDVDTVVLAFSSLSAYRPTLPFDVHVDGVISQCTNIKLLDGIFGHSRKGMFG